MDLILWRHCEAEPGEPDLGRRLTSKGLKQAERMAAWLDAHLPDTCRILVSPADRAQQTALALQRKFKTVAELGPGASVSAVLAAANWPESREPVLIVGHQPTLGAVASFHGGGLVNDTPNSPHLQAARTHAQFLIAIAANDDQRSPNEKTVLKDTFAKANLPAEIEVYEGSAHGWCPPDSSVYNEPQAEKAWTRLLALYGKALA